MCQYVIPHLRTALLVEYSPFAAPAGVAPVLVVPMQMRESAPQIWQVGALCRAIADVLDARFNPVAVRGEISGFSRAASGHCYFTLKDGAGQIRCAMFRRAASLLERVPREGDLVEVRGRLGVYEARGDLQLIVESLQQVGAGALFEQFLRLKAKLEGEGLFAPERKRPLPALPRGIGLVTSPGAAALHDVITALARRVPHVPVVLSPAAVQGAGAPAELAAALQRLYGLAEAPSGDGVAIDTILLVRGGGSIEDLWAFNDEALARVIARSPVPVVSGVGHETDFSIADFVADLRAPTPTAAAELVAQPRELWLQALQRWQERMQDAVGRSLDVQAQRLDQAAQRLGRPASRIALQRVVLQSQAQRLTLAVRGRLERQRRLLQDREQALPAQAGHGLERMRTRLERAALRLELLDPTLVLRRGYAWLSDEAGHTVQDAAQVRPGQTLHAKLSQGGLEMQVLAAR